MDPRKIKVNSPEFFEAHGRRFRVNKLGPTTWSLKEEHGSRSRFGNLKEIREDIAAIMESGKLPGPQAGRFA